MIVQHFKDRKTTNQLQMATAFANLNRIQKRDDVFESAMKPEQISRSGAAVFGLGLDEVLVDFEWRHRLDRHVVLPELLVVPVTADYLEADFTFEKQFKQRRHSYT